MSSHLTSHTGITPDITYYIQKTQPEQQIDASSSRSNVVQPNQTPRKQQFQLKHANSGGSNFYTTASNNKPIGRQVEQQPQISSPVSKNRISPRILSGSFVSNGSNNNNNKHPQAFTPTSGLYMHNVVGESGVGEYKGGLTVQSLMQPKNGSNSSTTCSSSNSSMDSISITPRTRIYASNSVSSQMSLAQRNEAGPVVVDSGHGVEVVALGDDHDIQVLVEPKQCIPEAKNEEDRMVIGMEDAVESCEDHFTHHHNNDDYKVVITPSESPINDNCMMSQQKITDLEAQVKELYTTKSTLELQLRQQREEHTVLQKSTQVDEGMKQGPMINIATATNNASHTDHHNTITSLTNTISSLKLDLKASDTQLIILKQDLRQSQQKQRLKDSEVKKDREYSVNLEAQLNQIKEELRRKEELHATTVKDLSHTVSRLELDVEHKMQRMHAKEKDALYFVFQKRVEGQIKRQKERFTIVETRLQQAHKRHESDAQLQQLERLRVVESQDKVKELTTIIKALQTESCKLREERNVLAGKLESTQAESLQWRDRLESAVGTVESQTSQRAHEITINAEKSAVIAQQQREKTRLHAQVSILKTRAKGLYSQIQLLTTNLRLNSISKSHLKRSNEGHLETMSELQVELLEWKTRALKSEREKTDIEVLSSLKAAEESMQLSGELREFMQGNWENVLIEPLADIADALGESE